MGHVPLTAGRNWLEGGVHVPLPPEPLELPLASVPLPGPDELLEPELELELVLELPLEPEADSAPLEPEPFSEPARPPEPLPLPPEPAPLDEEEKPPPEGDAFDPHPTNIPMPNVASENHRMGAIEAPDSHQRNAGNTNDLVNRSLVQYPCWTTTRADEPSLYGPLKTTAPAS